MVERFEGPEPYTIRAPPASCRPAYPTWIRVSESEALALLLK
jgi:hypothetical protein